MKSDVIGNIGYLDLNLEEVRPPRGNEVTVIGGPGQQESQYRLPPKVSRDLHQAVPRGVQWEPSGRLRHFPGLLGGRGYRKRSAAWEARVGLLGEAVDAESVTGIRAVHGRRIGGVGKTMDVEPGSVVYEEELTFRSGGYRSEGKAGRKEGRGEARAVGSPCSRYVGWESPGGSTTPWRYTSASG